MEKNSEQGALEGEMGVDKTIICTCKCVKLKGLTDKQCTCKCVELKGLADKQCTCKCTHVCTYYMHINC